jgi:hypothetical protein
MSEQSTYNCEFIQGEAFTAGLDDAGTGSVGEAECSNGQLGDQEKTIHVRLSCRPTKDLPNVISDSSNNDNGLLFLLWTLLGVHNGGNARQRNWWAYIQRSL